MDSAFLLITFKMADLGKSCSAHNHLKIVMYSRAIVLKSQVTLMAFVLRFVCPVNTLVSADYQNMKTWTFRSDLTINTT